jgi:outer membrane lipoprotein-sorting protein
LFLKFLITSIVFFNFFFSLNADEKKSIISSLLEVDNFSFSFEQTLKDKKETGKCLLAFNNKLRCSYNNELKKEIILNNKTLVVWKKKYNKKYFYHISKSLFLNILNKDKLFNLIQRSDLIQNNNNIELFYFDENQKKITLLFDKKNYELVGWKIENEFKDEIYFSLKIEKINNVIDKNYFKIPEKD